MTRYEMQMRYELSKAWDRFLMFLVWKLPRAIVYWSAIRVSAHASTGQYSDQVVPDLTAMDALKRWER